MDEMKTPKKPFIFYYILVLLIVMAFNLLVLPLLSAAGSGQCQLWGIFDHAG